MAKLSHLLITLPLMAVPAMALALRPAAAETVSPIEALELLAKSHALDAKCNALSSNQQEELNRYLAKAEIATTAQYPVDEARTAMIAGHKSAEAAPCSPTAAEEVKETLAAARDAMIEA